MNRPPENMLFVHQSSDLYGSDKVLLDLVVRNRTAGGHPIVLLPGPGPLADALRQHDIEVHSTPLCLLGRASLSPSGLLALPLTLWRSLRRLDRLLAGKRIDRVHSNTLAVLSGAFWARRHHLPHDWHVHEIIEQPVVARKFLAWLTEKMSDRVICVSQAVRQNLLRDRPGLADKATVRWNTLTRPVAPDAQAAQQFRQEQHIQPHEVLITLAGRFNRWKGQHLLLDAAERLLPRHLPVKYLLLGSPPSGQPQFETSLRQRIAATPLKEQVIMLPFDHEIWEIWDASDIVVVPSTEPEPFGLVAIEAMAAGKPVVAADHGGLAEIVLHQETGLLFSPGNAAELADALHRLIISPQDRAHMGAAGKQRQATCFSPSPQMPSHDMSQ